MELEHLLSTMWLHVYADLTVSSTLPLADLPAARPDGTKLSDFAFRLLASPPGPVTGNWLHRWHTNTGTPFLDIAKTGAGFLLRFPDLADFVFEPNERQIGAWPASGTNMETLRHLLLDQVLPRLLAHRGRLVVHAGAVKVDNRVIAFVGQTGWGKSTLSASFNAAGYPLLSDDGLVLTFREGCALALPTYPSLRLWPEAIAGLFAETPALGPMAHYSSKQRVVMEEIADTAGLPMPLAALYVLTPEGEVGAAAISLTRLSPRDACMTIIANAFQLDVTDHRRAAGLLAAAGDIAQHVPTFALSFPRDFTSLPAVRDAILGQRENWAGSAVDNSSFG